MILAGLYDYELTERTMKSAEIDNKVISNGSSKKIIPNCYVKLKAWKYRLQDQISGCFMNSYLLFKLIRRYNEYEYIFDFLGMDHLHC